MTMIDQNAIAHLLDGMVKCRRCGTPMGAAGEFLGDTPRYMCTTKNDGCSTLDIESEPFNRLVVRRAIHAFLDLGNTGKVFDIIRSEAMSEDNEDLRAALDWKETTPGPDDEPPPHGEDREPQVTVFPAGREIATDSLDSAIMVFHSGPAFRKVEEYSLNPDTYLRASNIQTTKAIMESLISEILVGPHSATIRYRLPVHPGGGTRARSSEQIQF
jgi:hypothetical protein